MGERRVVCLLRRNDFCTTIINAMTPEESETCLCSFDANGICSKCGLGSNGKTRLLRYCRVACPHLHLHLNSSVVSQPKQSLPGHEPQPPAPPPDLTRHDAPSFLTKVRNFASAAVSHVAAGMPMASDDEIIRRHDICLTCEHLQNDACQLCGCPVSRVAGYVSKLSWADQECPAGKWGRAPSA